MKFKTLISALFLLSFSTITHAEHSVPVYDVDSMSNDTVTQQTAAPGATPLSMEQQNDANKRLADLQGEVQTLRGQVEELSHRLQEVANQQQALRSDVDKQQAIKPSAEPSLSALSQDGREDVIKTKKFHTKQETPAATKLSAKKTLPSAEKKPSTTAANQPNVAEEQAVYQTAYNLIKAKKYNEAIASLQKMLGKYPSGQFAANAHYWLGELYSLTGQHQQAVSEFASVVKHYPSNPRVADSELKLGLIYATQLKWAEAKTSFNKVVHQFPGTAPAQLAMEQLKQLKQSGH